MCDSTWEVSDAYVLDTSDEMAARVKSDHLGFEILYIYRGVVRKHRPDFLVQLKSGDLLVLETKGQDTEQDQVMHNKAQDDVGLILKAVRFAAEKHRTQRRKDAEASPYINHPIALADVLKNEGGPHRPIGLRSANRSTSNGRSR